MLEEKDEGGRGKRTGIVHSWDMLEINKEIFGSSKEVTVLRKH